MSFAAISRASSAELRDLGQQLRVDSIRASDVAKSGHPTSSMSAADLMAVLFAKYLRYDFDQPENSLNDHLIFSKGHASPLLYSLYLAAGAISEEELLSFRTFGSRLQGISSSGRARSAAVRSQPTDTTSPPSTPHSRRRSRVMGARP
jgi:transketolase